MKISRLHSSLWIAIMMMFLPSVGVASEIDWQKFDSAALAKAREEKKLVFLDVEAVWCHWCHVMEKKTFSEPEVQKALSENFICTKLDQDSRPDLSRRYEDYGWPALVILDPVIMKERAIASGFQTKEEFIALLQTGRDNKGGLTLSETAKAATKGALTREQKQSLLEKLRDRYDPKATGWGRGNKFVAWENIEYCIRLSENGDQKARKIAEDTLSSATRLIDPVWGGTYQYSTDGDWEHPHFEKIMEFEAEISRVYALAFMAWGRAEDLAAAENIARHIHDFLRSPEGAYYVSQDADVVQGEHSTDFFAKNDKDRRATGMPHIDQHVYSRDNGLAISAMVTLYQATGKPTYLDDAKTAAAWVIAYRALPDGGFSHDQTDSHGPFLSDQAYMGRALLQLYQATADRKWLDRSTSCAGFCLKKFKRSGDEGAGFFSGGVFPDAPPPVVNPDENIQMSRWLNLLSKTTRELKFSQGAEHALRFLATDKVIGGIYSFSGGLLLADEEAETEPIHMTIVGAKDDANAALLFKTAQQCPTAYKIIEWLSPGATADGEITYPDSDRAAAYLCTGTRCSLPKFTAAELTASFGKK